MSGLSPLAPIRPYRSHRSGFGSSFPSPVVEKTHHPRSPSVLSILRKLHAQQKPHHSFFGKVLHKGSHSLETALDYAARPSYALMEGIREGDNPDGSHKIYWGKVLHGLGQGIHAHKRTGLGTIIRERDPHFAKHHKVLTPLIGTAGDIAADPLNLLIVGGVTKGAKIPAELLKASEDIQSGRMAAKDLPAARDLFAKHGWDYHRALAEHELNPIPAAGAAEKAPEATRSMLQAASRDELMAHLGPKHIGVQVKIPGVRAGSPYKGLVRRGRLTLTTPIKAPSLRRISEGKGFVGTLSRAVGGPAIAEHLGRALKPGWDNAKFHAIEMVAKHTHEQLNKQYLDFMATHLGRFHEVLTDQQMRDALHKGIQEEHLLGKGRRLDKRVLRRMVRSGKLTSDQAAFLKEWHNVTEYLRHHDTLFGVKYEKELENKLYVPALRDKFGQPLQITHLTKPGFAYARMHSGRRDIELMNELVQKSEELGKSYKSIETNPVTLLAMRARRGAQTHASQAAQNVIAHAEGVSSRIINPEKVARLRNQITHHEAQKADIEARLRQFADSFDIKHERRRLRRLATAESTHNKRLAQLTTNIRKTRAAIGKVTREDNLRKAARKGKLPTHGRLMSMSNADWQKYMKLRKPSHISDGRWKLFRDVREKTDVLRRERIDLNRIAAKARKIAPKTGTKAHGSSYKGLVAELQKAFPEHLDKKVLTEPMKKGDSWKKRFDDSFESMKNLHAERTKEAASQWDYIRPKGPAPLHAIRQKQLNAIEREKSRYQAQIDQIEGEEAARRAVVHPRLEERMVRDSQRLDIKTARLEKYYAQLANPHDYPHLSMSNPEVENKNLRILDALKDEHGVPMAVSHEMADGLARVRTAISNDQFVEEFGRMWSRLVSRWKVGVTVVNPGYRARNTMSDLWNMYVSGVPLWGITRYGEKAAHLMVAAKRGDENAIKIIEDAYRHGVLSGLFEGDINRVMRMLKGRHTAKELAKDAKFIQATTRIATTFNTHAENWGRLTHYLYRRDYERMGSAEAAAEVKAAHFDYEDLTPFERKLKGGIVPFYTWTRKNIPFQIAQLLSRPGRYAAFPKFTNEMEQASGDNSGQLIPSWMKQQLAFHVPFGGKGALMVPNFMPTQDIEKLQHPTQLAQMANPFMKTPFELLLNRSMLTGAPIYGNELKHPRNPIAEWAGPALSLIPGSNVGPTERPVHGKQMRGEGANPLLTYFLGQMPWANLALNQSKIKKAQRGGGNGALASWLSGISTYQPDQESQLAQLMAQEQLSEAQWIRGLRDMGVIPESTRKKGPSTKRIERILKHKHTRR